VQHHIRTARTPLLALAAAALLACASPVPPASLVNAEQAYAAAANDPRVSENAPVNLYEAKKHLDRAQETFGADSKDPRVEHYAYLAEKRVQIARELADKRVSDEEARELARERDQVLLGARTGQVDVARIEAERARERLQEETDRAAALEEQLAALQARKTERGMVITLGDVLFDTGKSQLRGGAQQNLYQLVTFLRENKDREVMIEGHTDSVGSESYNLGLSEQRAESVRGFLTQNGVDPARTAARGFGESRPVASNETPAGRQQNRRVEAIILDPGRRAAQEILR